MRFREKYAFLSNFYPAEVEYEGITFRTSEHAYQAAKTLGFSERRRIAAALTPALAKKMGRTITMRSDWEDVKLAVMEDILHRKFRIPALRQMLLDTWPEKIVEDNTWGDRFWGVYDGRGSNHLGKLLMKVRLEIREARDLGESYAKG